MFPWKRFWCPRSGSLNLADGGYLVDPDADHGAIFNPDVVGFEKLVDIPCLALLGEPGIGKSTALEVQRAVVEQGIADAGNAVLWIDLKEFGDESRLIRAVFESPEFSNWLRGTYSLHLFLDSLDECRLQLPYASAALLAQLRKVQMHIPRLRLRIACRTAEWPSQLEAELPKVWGEDSVSTHELVPLRRVDVKLAAESSGIDPEDFLEEIDRLEAVPLAIKPVTLNFLLKTYQRDGRFPSTQVALYDEGCKLLCAESSASRRDAGQIGTISAAQRQLLAARIAAGLAFCGKSAIFTGSNPADARPDDLLLTELEGAEEAVSGLSIPAAEVQVREVLATGLFSGRGSHRLGFAHQTYAEFLAARFLVTRAFEPRKILTLLRHADDNEGRVVPQLHEVAAWVASMQPDVFGAIMATDPQVLLRSDVAKTDNRDKASLVASLLSMLDAERLVDFEWELRLQYSKLNHPKLAGQLAPYIRDRAKNIMVRRVAIDIAEACNVQSLQGVLADVALDATDSIHICVQAGYGVARIGDERTRSRLKPLALGPGTQDPDDELKGVGLQAVWPGLINARDLFASITMPKHPSLHGAYAGFLDRKVVPGLEHNDLAVALEWVSSMPRRFGLPHSITSLMAEIIAMASQHLDDPIVLRAFAGVALSRIRCHDDLIDEHESKKEIELLFKDDDRRHELVKVMLGMMPDFDKHGVSFVYGRFQLVRGSDLSWLIASLRSETGGDMRHNLAKLAKYVFDYNDPAHLEEILSAVRENEELQTEFKGVLAPVFLDSPEAQEMKQRFLEAEQYRRERRPRPKLAPPPKSRIEACLTRFEGGDVDAWWLLCLEMTLKDTSTHYEHEYEPDLRSLPGWEDASVETRTQIVAAAKRYVLEADPQEARWAGKGEPHRPAMAGLKALLLLRSESPSTLDSFPVDVWARWALAVVAYPSMGNDDEPTLSLVKQTYERAPEAMVTAVLREIEHDNSQGDYLPVLQRIERCWDQRLCAAMLIKAQDEALKPRCFGDLLHRLLKHGCVGAREFAATLVVLPVPIEASARTRVRTAASGLLSAADHAGWEAVWPVVQADAEFGRELLLELAYRSGDRHSAKFAARLSPDDAADLYVWLSRQFPHAEDPDHRGEGAYSVGPREQIADFRNAILRSLKQRGSIEACNAIQRIAGDLPHLEWMKWELHEAKQVTRRQTWRPLKPDEFMELVRQPNSALVQSSSQLLDLLVDSLGRFEAKLQGETPLAFTLWDEISKGVFRPKNEAHLADAIKGYLEDDIGRRGVISLREVEIRRGERHGSGKPKGERTDIHVTGVVPGLIRGTFDQVRVIIEVKGCWNPELMTAMKSQLLDRYLKDNRCQNGLYLVTWHNCQQWDPSDPRRKKEPTGAIHELRDNLVNEASSLSISGGKVKSVVINAALR